MLSYSISMAATAVFAITGVLAAGRTSMDIVGVVFLGIITALGGGTLRDLLIHKEIFWIADFNYVWIAMAASILTFFFAHKLRDTWKWLLYFDALGVALFGVQAVDKVLLASYSYPVAVVMATLTGIGGGILRDVLVQRPNLLLTQDIYATPIITGSIIYLGLLATECGNTWAMLLGIGFTVIFRMLVIYYGWTMPACLTLKAEKV